MNRLTLNLWRITGLCGLALACFTFVFLSGIYPEAVGPAGVHPLAQITSTPTPTWTPMPTCSPPAPPSPSLPPLCVDLQVPMRGYQPLRHEIRPIFNAAAGNGLGGAGPDYFAINHDLPPEYGGPGVTPIAVSSAQPIPHVILRGMGYEESFWKQFSDNWPDDPDGYCYYTLIAGDCGYGLTQLTWCMIHPGNSECLWLDQGRTAGELLYNLGAGTNWFIANWNWLTGDYPPFSHNQFIGSNDHTAPVDWYYAVAAYNGWSECNDPNRNEYLYFCPVENEFDPRRRPFGEGEPEPYVRAHPYQERLW